VQKILEDAGMKLDSVASDLFGLSGRAMLQALVDGERDPERLAQLAKGKLRAKIPMLNEAMRGRFQSRHATMLRVVLAHIHHLEEAIASLDVEIDREIKQLHDLGYAVALTKAT
jgi:transposase